jgi:hypothetical protein
VLCHPALPDSIFFSRQSPHSEAGLLLFVIVVFGKIRLRG